MIDLRQLRAFIIKPALLDLGLWSEAAEELLIGTGLVESLFTHLRQLPDGPALGFWQMEPATHDDIFVNYLQFRHILAGPVLAEVPFPRESDGSLVDWPPLSTLLVTNLRYAAMLARLHYRRVSEPLPAADDVEGMAMYWEKYYNSAKGKGRAEEFIRLYKEHAQ